ncbi:hypothetical protein SAMN05443572_106553 [Myxococcus fulvus]|uniref:Uncharacterized protein n=1 Tax=Myxococcus fulvus TaxID=33 RepID=A0A511T1K0_MYXFU|nr:hypothetical protein [Myxococcus fulvus]GEN08025.1 hypothetical protein MFU01_30620 [Myxococcus fulvus]SEU23546.1 hypothetical protein SAMN05443572_106553 [Myxococcus fulvus]
MPRSDLDNHRRILGISFLVVNGLTVLFGIGAMLFFTVMGLGIISDSATASDRTDFWWFGGGVSVCILVYCLPGLFTGIGLLKRRTWSRVLALVLGILNLANFPLGTCLGIYALWFYAQEGSDRVFE